jgi:tetratricopeptide (TPR) repeat protein
MSESRHRELPGAADAADRESRTEALLVDGLDQYFQGHFDEAIHLWTRVLFIDRTHARARAYINRARTAQAEGLRRTDEMLQTAGELLSRGDLAQARRLLANAEQASGADEKVAELWARLERVERTRQVAATVPAIGIVDARPVRNWRRVWRVAAQTMAAGAFAVLLVSVVGSPVVGEWITGNRGAGAPRVASVARPLEVLSVDDVALVRARQLYARGRLAEALDVLDRVDGVNGSRESVDRLRVEIQRWLLMSRQNAAVTSATATRAEP